MRTMESSLTIRLSPQTPLSAARDPMSSAQCCEMGRERHYWRAWISNSSTSPFIPHPSRTRNSLTAVDGLTRSTWYQSQNCLFCAEEMATRRNNLRCEEGADNTQRSRRRSRQPPSGHAIVARKQLQAGTLQIGQGLPCCATDASSEDLDWIDEDEFHPRRNIAPRSYVLVIRRRISDLTMDALWISYTLYEVVLGSSLNHT
jgi:hypothetical protein